MNELLKLATISLERFLEIELPKLSQDWWQSLVKSKLSYQQQRLVEERGHSRLEQLDLAALLRVLDQNWYEVQGALGLPFEGRNWVKEMQSVRNKWAHLSTEGVPGNECYRDADTLGRLLEMLGAKSEAIDEVEAFKREQLSMMVPAPVADMSQDQVKEEIESDVNETLFAAGSLAALRSDPSTVFAVVEVVTGGDETSYKVFHNNSFSSYFESQLQPVEIDTSEAATWTVEVLHAYLTSLQLLNPSTSRLYSLRSGRVKFVPYQYRPVMKMIRADRPRLLIADEVGVGKTIESGLLIKELRARMDIQTILIICPKALVAERKWELEMKRFDEQFTPLDGPMLRTCLEETHLDGDWPPQYSKVIVPFSLINERFLYGVPGKSGRRVQGLLKLDPPPKFDLVIVDEAHHLRNTDTYLHQTVRYFCDHAQAAVFLTATPVQLGSRDLFVLLNTLRPDLIIDHESFERMAEPNTMINRAVHLCRTGEKNWHEEARGELDLAAHTRWGQVFLGETPGFQAICDSLDEAMTSQGFSDGERVKLVHRLEGLYTFSSLINRTRRRDIGSFTTRKPETLNIPFTAAQQALHDDLLLLIADILEHHHGAQNVKFMMTTIRRQASSCLFGLAPLLRAILTGNLAKLEAGEGGDDDDGIQVGDVNFGDSVRSRIEEIATRAESLDSEDHKLESFLKVLGDKSAMEKNKALVFSTFRHTLAYLEVHLEKTSLRFGVVHGGVRDAERAELRRRFSLPKEDPESLDILLSSEVGCEGLDFQFCDLLVNYDLPWNPMRVEQRIGRIDRYGQESETVSIVNLITPDTVDADIYERCLLRIGVFHQAIGGSEEILGSLTQQIRDIAESYELNPEEQKARFKQLADNEIRQVQEEQGLEEKGAELFGLSVPKHTWEKDLEDAESFWLSERALQQCVESYLADLTGGANHIKGDKEVKTLRLNQDARSLLLGEFKSQEKSMKRGRSTDPVTRQWERWLKGADATLPVTFRQKAAAESVDTSYLNVLHPLVRQAARHLSCKEAAEVHLKASCSDLEEGIYPFAIHRWEIKGVREDEQLKAVALEPSVEASLLELVQTASNAESPTRSTKEEGQLLSDRHYQLWRMAQAEHIAENQAMIEQRRQSLVLSHQARRSLLDDQIAVATNEKILRMKQSELARAEADFQIRNGELDRAASSGDLHATPIISGTITIKN